MTADDLVLRPEYCVLWYVSSIHYNAMLLSIEVIRKVVPKMEISLVNIAANPAI